jgi:hypothetical protein
MAIRATEERHRAGNAGEPKKGFANDAAEIGQRVRASEGFTRARDDTHLRQEFVLGQAKRGANFG